MSVKKVLLATRPLVPPWDEASKNFAYFLGKEVSGHSLTLLTTYEKLDGLPVSVHEETIFSEGHFNLRAKIELFWYLRRARESFDITHYLFTPTKFNTTLLKCFARPTTGKTLQTVATLRDDLYSPHELKKLFFADALITYTERAKEKLNKLGFKNVTRIYPGIDLNLYRPQPKNPKVLAQYGISVKDYFVMYPGEYTRLGATDMLAEAFTEYFLKHPESNVKFAFTCRIKNDADRAKRESLRAKVNSLGLEKKILFEENPSQADMPSLYTTADVVIFPVENLRGKFDVPLVIIEAYACGKPVILSDLPQFREFANDQICVTIPKDSKTKLIESVLYLRDNPVVRDTLGRKAREFTEEHFDLKNTAKQYEEVYTSL